MRGNPRAYLLQDGARIGGAFERHGIRNRHAKVVGTVAHGAIGVEHPHMICADAGGPG